MAMLPLEVTVVGAGRLGTALTRALRQTGTTVIGPLPKGMISQAQILLLCVPDSEISRVAHEFAGRAAMIGHVSGATPLTELAAAGVPAFGLHPLQTFAGHDGPERFHDIGCAIAGTTAEALATAERLAVAVGMRPFEINDADRPSYHAAASMLSGFLVTVAQAAEQVAAGAGIDPVRTRELFAPLVQTTFANWRVHGPRQALTGPVARGDWATVQAQRAAIDTKTPEVVELFDVLVKYTAHLAAQEVTV